MGERRHFLDEPRNLKRFIRGFFAACAVLFGLDFVVPRHGEFAFDGYPGFYAAFGLVACVCLVLAAKHILRRAVKRGEDYYD